MVNSFLSQGSFTYLHTPGILKFTFHNLLHNDNHLCKCQAHIGYDSLLILLFDLAYEQRATLSGALSTGVVSIVTGEGGTANMRRWLNVGLLLGQRRRRWVNSKPTLSQHPIFARRLCTARIPSPHICVCYDHNQSNNTILAERTIYHP